MWCIVLTTCLLTLSVSIQIRSRRMTSKIFRNDQIVFASPFNITSILVPADGNRYINTDSSEIPTIFFTASDTKMEGESCIYVLEGLAAYEILEGGRDSTADYSFGKNVYFGAKDGLYKYDAETLSAKKFGPFIDDIIQLQKANGNDAIFILNSDHKLYKIEKQGSVKSRVQSVICAVEFVLDTSDNIYYISCDDHMPHVVQSDGSVSSLEPSILEDFKDFKLLRPAFIMERSIPFFGDGNLYILYSNGSSEKKDFSIDVQPSAFSIDAALYLVAAVDGKIYEFNVMEVLLKSMFGATTEWPMDLTRIIMSIIETSKDGVHNFYKDWNMMH